MSDTLDYTDLIREAGELYPEVPPPIGTHVPNGTDDTATEPRHGTPSVPNGTPLRWVTAAELAALEPEHPAWLHPGYVARGVITELSAKIKTGKTTLALSLTRAIVTGTPFLGHECVATPTCYLTEERAQTFRSAIARVGLEDCANLHILFRQHSYGQDWPDVAAAATQYALSVGAGCLWVDTLSDWANVRGDAENDAGAAMDAMRPLHAAAAAGLAVVSVRHSGRNPSSDVAESGRGSSAFGGAADIILSLRRVPGQGHENRRLLAAVGRFDETPAELVVDFVDGAYTVIGTKSDAARRDALDWLRDNLTAGRDWALTLPQVEQRAKDAGEVVSRSTLQRALGELQERGEVESEIGAAIQSPRARGYWLVES